MGEVMAVTKHRSVGTVMGYFQAGALVDSRAGQLFGPTPVGNEPAPDHESGSMGATAFCASNPATAGDQGASA